MCGVVAIARFGLGPEIDQRRLERMTKTVAHRGPDDATTEIVDHWVGLGHRRLSIIDVAGARQPLHSEDGNVVSIYNGEIFNFIELRARLVALGHTFTTCGDGEVIVHGYEQWGVEIFSMLEGQFAVVLVDRRRQRLYAARDRFGIKPLFFTRQADCLLIASELKAIMAARDSRTGSRLGLAIGATRMHVPWPLTALDGVYRLPPGAMIELRASGELHCSRLMPMVTATDGASSAPEDALATLRQAVARQMVADVPVGAFLSGGVDSTLIVTLMREVTNAEIHTFSIRTLDHDESDVASQTARELGTTHHTIPLEQIRFEDLNALAELFGEPFAETSALGVRTLSRFAREHVTVALSGDGGDEVFGGYDSYRWIRGVARLPLPGRGRLEQRSRELLALRPWSPLIRRLLRTTMLLGADPMVAQRDLSTLSWAAEPMARASSETLSSRILEASGIDLHHMTPVRKAMLADRLERLPNAMLTKVDIASMSASLEVRVPMLDDALVRYADRLSVKELNSLRFGKTLLRNTLGGLPGGRVAWARKRGFSLPLDRWMASPEVASRMEQLLNDNAARLLELTDHDVGPLWRTFREGGSRFSTGTGAMQLLWFASVAVWAERYGITGVADRSLDEAPIV